MHSGFWRELRRWRGVLLIGVISIATIWLAVTGQLVLYIHPRYDVLTIAMAVVAVVFTVARVLLSGRDEHEHDEHEHDDHEHDDEHDDTDDDDLDARPLQRGLSIAALAVSALLAMGAVLLPPATLSAATATQRDITTTNNTDAASLEEASSADAATFARYGVLEWSSLLAQSSDPSFYAGKTADIVGFITPDPTADDVFYVSRFTITCCAVDAQPVGVPVYAPNWQQQFAVDDWIRVTGEFGANRSSQSSAAIALLPEEVEGVEQPRDPYLF